ncbi:chitin-binding protein [Clostridium sporogenes]|uniref:DUF3472 domain-containing protein n=1 Tax=Clostridium botulinum TaxID=1491 RepID=UPI000717A6C9|nr:DUF3472 domain-containing protein [Clostridium botulinum]KRU27464.1 chitin-binding protein [Clostridium sporogenes]KRU27776.1 chitin-binding protein [Clostridium sporogenes]KRU32140.1 chitin-binding protein [Clostridium sporogenes]KRU45004.1 chitin-binding protein [Clostridium sporogenes]MBZ1330235.1 DUF3472 domain-containing protein [Clostridium botulinum]
MKKKSLLIGIINLLIIFGIVNINTKLVYAYTNATGMYVNPVNEKKADIMTVDWSTTKNAPNTYWAVHNWNAGGEAGGYAGFQQRTDRRTLHFAIWDPVSVRQPIEAEYLSSSSTSSRFGGEGEGMKVETDYEWKPNSWYKMTMRNWQEDGHTKFGQWVRDESTKEWKQIAVLDFPVANVNFGWGTGMFQEDWAGNGQDVRNARLKNLYSRSVLNKDWNSLYQQKITSQYPNKNWDGGGNSEYVWVEAGGNTKPTMTSGQVFNINQPSKPDVGTLDFDITNAKYENNYLNISWNLKNQSTPQFKGKIEIYNNSGMTGTPIKTINNIKSYENSVKENCQLASSTGLYAKVIITDLFDNTLTKTVTLTGSTESNYKGSNFTFDFKGLGDWLFGQLSLDLSSNEAKIDIKKGQPHVYFKDSYASLSIKDNEGNTVYTKDFIGDKTNEALVKNIHIKTGYYITIKHQESEGRLLITNLDNKLELEKGNSITYKITDDGLVKASEDEINKSPENEWNPSKSYNTGDKVSYKGKTYKAKWWSHGFAPDTKVQNSWETPWELIS